MWKWLVGLVVVPLTGLCICALFLAGTSYLFLKVLRDSDEVVLD